MGIIKWKCPHCMLILKKWTSKCPSCGKPKLEVVPGSVGVTEEELLMAGFKV